MILCFPDNCNAARDEAEKDIFNFSHIHVTCSKVEDTLFSLNSASTKFRDFRDFKKYREIKNTRRLKSRSLILYKLPQ